VSFCFTYTSVEKLGSHLLCYDIGMVEAEHDLTQDDEHESKPKKSFRGRHRKLVKWVLIPLAVLTSLVIIFVVAFEFSPWPSSLIIRYAFDKGSAKTSAALEKEVPVGIASDLNQQYSQNDSDAYLDVYYPSEVKDTSKTLPTVVWVHGGAWVSGDKKDVANYAKIVASKGYTVVSVGYSIAPEKHYPVPVIQTNKALAYLDDNAERLHSDSSHIALAGDSAGSQIVAQEAAIITNPTYAKQMDIKPSLTPRQLGGMVLNCGVYDAALPDYAGIGGKLFFKPVLRAYSGQRDFLNDASFKTLSVVNYVTKDFPPSFITAGNADPLLEQSTKLAAKLESLGVETDTLFYAKDHQPQLSHEYQFNLGSTDGQQALTRTISFLNTHIR
jgi:acetyl esterase